MRTDRRFSDDQIQAVRLVVAQAASVLQTAYEKIADGCIDMPRIDKAVLSLVAARPDLILREVVAELGIPNSTLTSAVDRLEKRGLLTRVISKRDRRSFGLQLTPGGTAYMALQDQAEQAFAIKILEILETDEERRGFVDTLSKVVSRLQEFANER